MHPEGRCNICSESIVEQYPDDLDGDRKLKIKQRRDYCPECKNLLEDQMTERFLHNLDEIKAAINSINEAANNDDTLSTLKKSQSRRVQEQLSVLKDQLGISDEDSTSAFERRNSVFIQVKFTYDRASSRFPEAINEMGVVDEHGDGRDGAPWKMYQDEGDSTSTEGHSRAVLVIEINGSTRGLRGKDLIKLEGAINAANGDDRNNARVNILNSAPEWFWKADWGMNAASELEDEDE